MIIDIRGRKVEIYDDATEMPSEAYYQFNRVLIQEVVADGIEGLGKHVSAVKLFVDQGMKEQAYNEIDLYYLSIVNILKGKQIKREALSYLVKAIDGKPVSQSRAYDILGHTKQSRIADLVDTVKKKCKAILLRWSIKKLTSKVA